MSKTTSYRLGIEVEIEARKGADFQRRFHTQVYSGDTVVDYDLSVWTGATLEVRRKPSSPISELTFNTSDSTIVLGDNGRFDLIMNAENMNGIRAGEYEYDMYLTNDSTSKRDFMYGKFIISDRITR